MLDHISYSTFHLFTTLWGLDSSKKIIYAYACISISLSEILLK